MVVVLKTKKHIPTLQKLEDKFKDTTPLTLELRGYTLWELKTGRRLKKVSSNTPPVRFNAHIPHFKCIYGKDISNLNLKTISAQKSLKGMINVFEKSILKKNSEME